MSIISDSSADLDDCPNLDVPPHPGRKMTEEEFVEWSGDFWAEWVDGEVVMMMTVNRDHAFFESFLLGLFGQFVDRRDLGAVLSEPFQVRLGAQRRRRAPDVFFIAKERLDIILQQQVEGAPDLVVEILSPQSKTRDRREKYADYESAGVREYWIVDPEAGKAEVYALRDGKFAPLPEQDGKIGSLVLSGFFIRPKWLTQTPLPRVHEALRDMGI